MPGRPTRRTASAQVPGPALPASLVDSLPTRRAVLGASLAAVSAVGTLRGGLLEARVVGGTRSAAARSAVDPASVSWVATSAPVVALTFDDGPDPATTPAVLDVLARHDARATFFVVGSCVDASPDLVRRMVDEGHTLANHTYDHAPLELMRRAQVRDQLVRGRAAVDRFASGPRLARPPRGRTNATVASVCAELGEREVFWSACLESTRGDDPEARGRALARSLGPGDVVLAHDGGYVPGRWGQSLDRRPSVQALEPFLVALRERDLQVEPLPQLLARHTD